MSEHGDFVFYHYTPNLFAGALFAALFGLSTAWHIVQLIRTRTWSFIPLVIGGICTLLPSLAPLC